ncbi:uncharacterized protein LOC143018480 [Oratosquilla oratoria]|uniref:uncharacterized protein LOC143018480 n=1 Tax=Oratosquilla oratoria TaxID=337810 RepID=UPI003F76F3CC
MLNEIPQDTPSIDLRFRMDGGVFNPARLRARTKTTICPVQELQYANDNATPGQTAEDLQSLADAYNAAYERFRMQVNTDKTKILVQHPPGLLLPNTNTIVNGQPLEEVYQFTYLGSILTSTPTCKKDVENRIRAAHSAFEPHHQPGSTVLDRASLTSVEATIIHHRLRWAGHILRMDPSRLPKKMLYGELANGTRPRGAPKLCYKDQLKHTLAMTNIDPSSWEQTARDRTV